VVHNDGLITNGLRGNEVSHLYLVDIHPRTVDVFFVIHHVSILEKLYGSEA
jgi:hypothetical protein